MWRKILISLGLVVSITAGNLHAYAAEPSLHEVYQAARTGQYREAQTMMEQVLRSHPDSAKAHFVEAELLAKQGQIAKAASELQTAERLAPGLPFAKPAAVSALRARLGSSPVGGLLNRVEVPAFSASGMPWGLLMGVGLIGALFFLARAVTRPKAAPNQWPRGGNDNTNAFRPNGQGMSATSVGPTPWGGGSAAGAGSGLLGSLATGAAVGAGLVAGEALVHRMLDGEHSVGNNFVSHDASPSDWASKDDLGGDDFGVADASSWDDGGSSVDGDDWT